MSVARRDGANPECRRSLLLKHLFILSSQHPVRELLQRQSGHGRAERVCVGENDCGADCDRRRRLETVPGQCAALAERLRQSDTAAGRDGGRILYGPVGVRWLEQSELRDGGDQKSQPEFATFDYDWHSVGHAVLCADQFVVFGGHVAHRDGGIGSGGGDVRSSDSRVVGVADAAECDDQHVWQCEWNAVCRWQVSCEGALFQYAYGCDGIQN